MGIFAAAAVSRFGRDILGDTGVRSGARMISLAILAAQRDAIRTGDSHGLEFQGSAKAVTSWTMVRLEKDGARQIVDGPYVVPIDYVVSVSADEVLFDFEGNGMNGFQADFHGPHRNWQVSVAPLTQMISSQEIKP